MSSCIVRIDDPGNFTHGWQARAYIRAPRYVSRFFSDRVWGSRAQALAAARYELAKLDRKAWALRKKTL